MMKNMFLFLMLGIILSIGVSANQVDINASLNVEEYDWGIFNTSVEQNIVLTAGENTTIEVNFSMFHDLGIQDYISEDGNRIIFAPELATSEIVNNGSINTTDFVYNLDDTICDFVFVNTTHMNGNCVFDIPYWTSAGVYTTHFMIKDNNDNEKIEEVNTTIAELSVVESSGLSFDWSSVLAGQDNVTADSQITLSNLGNVDFNNNDITGSGMAHSVESDTISADSFYVNDVQLSTSSVGLGFNLVRDTGWYSVDYNTGVTIVPEEIESNPQNIEAKVNVPYVIGGSYTSVTDWVR